MARTSPKKRKPRKGKKSNRTLLFNPPAGTTHTEISRSLVNLINRCKTNNLRSVLRQALTSRAVQTVFPARTYEISSLFKGAVLRGVKAPEDVVIFLCERILAHSEEVSSELKSIREIERSLMQEDKLAVRKKLDDHLVVYGISLWWIEKQINAVYFESGVKGAGEEIDRLNAESENEFLSFMFNQFFMKRNFDSPKAFINAVLSFLNEFRSGGLSEFADVLSSMLIPFEWDPKREPINHLYYISNAPIIDQYLALKRALMDEILRDELKSIPDNAVISIRRVIHIMGIS